jgi:diadenylate cyclase
MQWLVDYVAYLQVDWKDLVEILVVAYLFYRVLLLWTGTRALQILLGLVLLVGVYGLANYLDLGLIEYLLSQAFTYGAFALIVVFQPELRNALARLGRSRVWELFPRLEESEVAEEVAEAAERLSRAKIGALIAVEREVGLGEYVENNGTRIAADVSAELITTIFTPYSPLHDGAVVVRGDQIVAAGCILPLTQFPVEDRSLGTRHRAALGLSEETDAYVVVVSEETAQISLAVRGTLYRDLTPDELRARLASEDEPAEAGAAPGEEPGEPAVPEAAAGDEAAAPPDEPADGRTRAATGADPDDEG